MGILEEGHMDKKFLKLSSRPIKSCGACPTIFEFEVDGEPYYFRLRHGYARIVNENTSDVLISGYMDGCDGVCDWDETVKWAESLGIIIE